MITIKSHTLLKMTKPVPTLLNMLYLTVSLLHQFSVKHISLTVYLNYYIHIFLNFFEKALSSPEYVIKI